MGLRPNCITVTKYFLERDLFMKKIVTLLLSFALVIGLVACGNKDQTQGEDTTPAQLVSMTATVLSISDNSILVSPVEGDPVNASADQISVSLIGANVIWGNREVGDIVEIFWNGEIMESYPAQIANVSYITLKEKGSDIEGPTVPEQPEQPEPDEPTEHPVEFSNSAESTKYAESAPTV